MYTPYNERCKGCSFAGKVSKPIKNGNLQDLRFIECLRDNEATKDRFKLSGKKEDLELWNKQEGKFLNCIYYDENADIFNEN
jgi:tRNA G26 N,N-dimethylase Trm1